MRKYLPLLITCLSSLFLVTTISATEIPGRPDYGVYDPHDYLTKEVEDQVKKYNTEHKDTNGAQLGVYITDSLGYDSIENFSNQVAKKWQIGFSNTNNGMLLLLAIKDREMRLETSDNIQHYYISNSEAREILDKEIGLLRENQISKAVSNMITSIEQETVPLTKAEIKEKDKNRELTNNLLKGAGLFGFIAFVIACIKQQFEIDARDRKILERSQFDYEGDDKLYPWHWQFVENDTWTKEKEDAARVELYTKRSAYHYKESNKLYPHDPNFVDTWTKEEHQIYQDNLLRRSRHAYKGPDKLYPNDPRFIQNDTWTALLISQYYNQLTQSHHESSSSHHSSSSTSSWSGGGFGGGGASSSW